MNQFNFICFVCNRKFVENLTLLQPGGSFPCPRCNTRYRVIGNDGTIERIEMDMRETERLTKFIHHLKGWLEKSILYYPLRM